MKADSSIKTISSHLSIIRYSERSLCQIPDSRFRIPNSKDSRIPRIPGFQGFQDSRIPRIPGFQGFQDSKDSRIPRIPGFQIPRLRFEIPRFQIPDPNSRFQNSKGSRPGIPNRVAIASSRYHLR
ncbi:MAG: hypothetical protein IPN69_24050 [Acidobacteria bacterium]|nr:hypothetical protein [Acidobacteriota bacterium]